MKRLKSWPYALAVSLSSTPALDSASATNCPGSTRDAPLAAPADDVPAPPVAAAAAPPVAAVAMVSLLRNSNAPLRRCGLARAKGNLTTTHRGRARRQTAHRRPTDGENACCGDAATPVRYVMTTAANRCVSPLMQHALRRRAAEAVAKCAAASVLPAMPVCQHVRRSSHHAAPEVEETEDPPLWTLYHDELYKQRLPRSSCAWDSAGERRGALAVTTCSRHAAILVACCTRAPCRRAPTLPRSGASENCGMLLPPLLPF